MINKILKELMNDPMTSTHRRQFRADDWQIIYNFISETENMNPNDRQIRLNRLFLDNPNRPKNWTGILEFLQFINSRIYRLDSNSHIN